MSRFAILVCALALAVGTVHADEAKEAEARQSYNDAQKQYALGQFDKAIELYRKAYELSERPTLLFNIAQAYRLSSDFKQAKFFYQSFLRAMPETPNRADVEQRIKEMDEALAKAKPEPVVPPITPPAPPKLVPGPEPEPAAPVTHRVGKPGLRIAGYATLGAGVVAIGLGVAFGLHAADLAKQVDGAKKTGIWTEQLSQTERDGASANTATAVLYGVGGALLVGGAVMWWLGREHDVTEAPMLAPSVAPHDVGLVLMRTF